MGIKTWNFSGDDYVDVNPTTEWSQRSLEGSKIQQLCRTYLETYFDKQWNEKPLTSYLPHTYIL